MGMIGGKINLAPAAGSGGGGSAIDTSDFLRKDGSVALTGAWDTGAQDITNIGTMIVGSTTDFGGGLQVVDSSTNCIELRDVDTDSTNKNGFVSLSHYTNSEEPLGLVGGVVAPGITRVFFGGGSATYNAATIVSFYAGATSTTTTGTEMMRITSTGVIVEAGGGNSASDLFHVSATGNGDALRIDDSTGFTGIGAEPGSLYALRVLKNGAHCIEITNQTGNNTVKSGIIAGSHYDTSEQAVGITFVQSLSSTSVLKIGGGAVAVNAITEGGLVAAANNTTTVGTEMLRWTTVGVHIESGVSAAADPSSILELTSTSQGFLPPRMTTTQRDNISSPATGLTIYNTSTNKLNFYNGTGWEAVTSA